MSTHDAAIPVIDLAAFRAGGRADKTAVARAVAAACEGSGFFHLPNHDAVLGGIAGDGDGVAPTVAEHYLGKVMKAAHGRLDAGVDDAMGAGG